MTNADRAREIVPCDKHCADAGFGDEHSTYCASRLYVDRITAALDAVAKETALDLARMGTAATQALYARIVELQADLAECYRLTGADPDSNDDATLAKKAVKKVRELRAACDADGREIDDLRARVLEMKGKLDAVAKETREQSAAQMRRWESAHSRAISACQCILNELEAVESPLLAQARRWVNSALNIPSDLGSPTQEFVATIRVETRAECARVAREHKCCALCEAKFATIADAIEALR